MNVIPYVTQFLSTVWNTVFSVQLTFLDNMTLKTFLIGPFIIAWGIGVYKFFVNGFHVSTDAISNHTRYERRKAERSSKAKND